MPTDRDLFRSEPVWSTIRLAYDLTPSPAGGSIFSGNFAGQAQADKVLFAFSYGISDTDAVKAGFGGATKPRRDMTVLDRAGIVPLGGSMDIQAITIMPQMILTPSSLATIDTRIDDTPGAQHHTSDWSGALTPAGVSDKELRTLLLDLAARALVPFWSYGEGEKRNYLGTLDTLVPQGALIDGSGHAGFIGKTLVLPEMIPWTMTGDTREFRVGFEIRQDQHNPAFAVAETFPATGPGTGFASLAAALGAVFGGVNPPAAGTIWANIDYKVFLHGVRREIMRAGTGNV